MGSFSTDNLANNNGFKVISTFTGIATETGGLFEGVKLGAAHADEVLRGTLDNKADSVWLVCECVGNSHSLAVGAEGDPEFEGNTLGLTLNQFLLDVDTLG